MKKINSKKGLAALMATFMGVSMFATTSASTVSAARGFTNTNVNISDDKDKAAKKERQMDIRNRINIRRQEQKNAAIQIGELLREQEIYQAQVNYVRNNLVLPALAQFEIEADEIDIENMAETLVGLGFNEVKLTNLINCLVEIMKQNYVNQNYLKFVLESYSTGLNPNGADIIFMQIITTLRNLTGENLLTHTQIKDILSTISSYVYGE